MSAIPHFDETSALSTCLGPLDADALRARFRSAEPFPFIQIDDFLRPEFAREVVAALPSVEEAAAVGHTFKAVNESGKTQVTDAAKFREPVRRLCQLMADPAWLETLSWITGIPKLLADDELAGGGIHVMRPGAHLDVHVDFNLIKERGLHRRLNILIFLNEGWQEDWAGCLELWDPRVRRRHHAISPVLSRCVVFETSEISYHGVQKVQSPPDRPRRSFAAYYYTAEPPASWNGRFHTTRFRARPEEHVKRWLLMPGSLVKRQVMRPINKARKLLGSESRDPS